MGVTEYLPLMGSGNLTNIQFIIIFIIGNIFTFFISRIKSKDTVQESLMKQAIERQNHLDVKQKEMMQSMIEEVDRVKQEVKDAKQETKEYQELLKTEQNRYDIVSTKYTELSKENRDLIDAFGIIEEQNNELQTELDYLKHENEKLKNQTKEIDFEE